MNHFGAVDDIEGGNTARTNINANKQTYWRKYVLESERILFELSIWIVFNFTFPQDPINADQIRQKRIVYVQHKKIVDWDVLFQLGIFVPDSELPVQE
jgi:hypothetical protein